MLNKNAAIVTKLAFILSAIVAVYVIPNTPSDILYTLPLYLMINLILFVLYWFLSIAIFVTEEKK